MHFFSALTDSLGHMQLPVSQPSIGILLNSNVKFAHNETKTNDVNVNNLFYTFQTEM